jgi:RNA polymerase subunit RPABC4/transcription elongation factor Spt4
VRSPTANCPACVPEDTSRNLATLMLIINPVCHVRSTSAPD